MILFIKYLDTPAFPHPTHITKHQAPVNQLDSSPNLKLTPVFCEIIKKLTFNFLNNLYYGILSKNFMNGNAYRLFFDDGLLFIRSLISFASDLQRVVNKMCQKFEVDFLLMQSYMNFPMVDAFMFRIGKAFNNKFIKVSYEVCRLV